MANGVTIQQILTKYWGFTKFRSLQEDVINEVIAGRDVLALLPTGGGKSVCFQVPALAREGICIVVSPLIALMKDQVDGLKAKGIKAMAITSAMTRSEIDIALDNCAYGDYKFLYVSPERLGTELFKARVKKMKVNFIAVDEAHCISQWGYDFRPSYTKIAELRDLVPKVPVLALTATATPEVAKDIQKKLLFKKENLLQASFERKNLAYIVLKEEDKLARLLKICNRVKGTGIVYVRNRKKTQEIASYLKANKISADFYHAGLNPKMREQKQNAWTGNKCRVMVCTNAFGMGIDKPDVRFVAHMDLPDCPEAYFQEAGRAGRDEKKSYATLLYNEGDRLELEHNMETSFPPVDEIKKCYQSLSNYLKLAVGSGEGESFEFDISDFSKTYELNTLRVFSALKFLEREGYITLTEALFSPSRIHFAVNKEELYKFQVANQKYDDFIKMLLRSYSGTFEQFTPISENELARRSSSSRETVISYLKYLDKMQILSYVPQTELPQVIFNQARLDAKSVLISKENYTERKKQSAARMEQVLSYAGSSHKCRSQFLLAYFGEKDAYRCGICDVCLERNKLELSDLEFEEINVQFSAILEKKNTGLQDLVASVKNFREEKSLKVAQWLLDSGAISYDSKNKLRLNK